MEQEENAIRCTSCGAIIIAKSLVNTKCAYCGSSQFIKENFDINYFPDAIIRFSNSNYEAERSLKHYIQKSSFLDNKAMKNYEIVSLTPIYVPSTVFNYGVETYQKVNCLSQEQRNISLKVSDSIRRASRYSNYHLSIDNKNNNKNLYSKSGINSPLSNRLNNPVNISFNGTNYERVSKEIYTIIQDGSKNVNDDFIYTIEPFDFSKIQSFNPTYLSGAYAEINEDNFMEIKALKKIKKAIMDSIPMDNGIVDCHINTIEQVNVYLPIWLANIKIDNSIYNFMMNDTTGVWVTNAKRKNIKNHSILFLFVLFILLMLITVFFNDYLKIIGDSLFAKLAIAVTFLFIVIFGTVIYPSIIKRRIKQSLIKDVNKTNVIPIQRSISKRIKLKRTDIPDGKTYNFYLDGKAI